MLGVKCRKNMITCDELPDKNEDLSTINVEFPYLKENTAASCPVSINEVMEYLAMESPDGGHLKLDDLEFIRTAKIRRSRYWIWQFYESDGAHCYVTVSAERRFIQLQVCIGYDENCFNLSPAQYILSDYCQCY